MTDVTLAGRKYTVEAASDIAEDAEALEFRASGSSKINLPDIIVVQFGEYGSNNVSVMIPKELPITVVDAALDYARKRLGIENRT